MRYIWSRGNYTEVLFSRVPFVMFCTYRQQTFFSNEQPRR